jgi:hypothetical protein
MSFKPVKIYTFADKSPQFIEWQNYSFHKFIKDDFEFIVVNNASSEALYINIEYQCEHLNIKSIDAGKKDFSHACFSCAVPLQWCIDEIISKDSNCISVIVDSDLILFKDFSFNEFIQGYDLAGIAQSRDGGYKIIEYIWNCFMIFDNDTMPNIRNFDVGPGMIWKAPLDVGGFTYYYLQNNPSCRWRKITNTSIIVNEFISLFPEHAQPFYTLDLGMEIFEDCWLHYRGGSNWDNKPQEYHNKKQDFIKKLLQL